MKFQILRLLRNHIARTFLILMAGVLSLGAAEKAPSRMRAASGESSSASLTLPVEAERDYVIKLRVRTEGSFVMTANGLAMASSNPGEWQELTGIIRTGNAREVLVTFVLQSLDGRPADAQLEGLRLDPLDKIPVLAAAQLSGETILIADQKTGAAIVYPAGNETYRTWAQSVREAVAKAGGPLLPVLTDWDVMESAEPQLRAEFSSRPLILLGRLTNNSAFWPSYRKFLDATDGYYPGGDGFVVRTAAGAGGGNTNHIILGGSSDQGVERAVQEFRQTLAGAAPSPHAGKECVLPYLLNVALEGDCAQAFDDNDHLWSSEPLSHLLPKVESGYGTVLRFYENAMAWYWSGKESYRERAREILGIVLNEKAYTHHYPLEFFVRTVRMLEGTGFFAEGEFPQVVHLLARNFQDFSSQELSWMGRFARPYDAIAILNRHQIAPWMSDLTNADFLRRYYPAGTDFGDVVAFRYAEKRAFLDAVVNERWGTSIPGVGRGGHEEEIVASLFRYALSHGQFGFFSKGNAQRAAAEFFAKVQPGSGSLIRPADAVDHQVLMGIMACYDRSPYFASLRRTLPPTNATTAPFMRRYVNGVHRYSPGPEVPDAEPSAFSGAWAATLMPHNERLVQGLKTAPFLGTLLSHKEILDAGVIRSGAGPMSDHLLLSGVLHDALPNTLLNLSSRGVHWLLVPSTQNFYEQNAVDVQRLDQWPAASRYASAARRNWVADWGVAGGLSSTLSPFSDTAWTRDILWLGEGLWVFRDNVRALKAGNFSATVTWVSAFPLENTDGSWRATSGDSTFSITPLSPDWKTVLDHERDSSWKTESYFLREKHVAMLEAGQSMSSVNLVQAVRDGAPLVQAEWKSPQVLALRKEGDTENVTYVGWPEGTMADLDAAAFVLDGKSLRIVQCRKLALDGKVVFSSPEPVDLVFDRGRKTVLAGSATTSSPVRGAEGLWPVFDALESSLRNQPAQPKDVPAVVTGASGAEIRDTPWRETWRYSGFRRPVPVRTGRTEADGVLDLERTYPLAEISFRDRSNAQLGALPDSILVAAPVLINGQEQMPDFDSPEWKEVADGRFWRPAIKSGNYGKADPLAEGYQAVLLNGLPVRYVRTTGANLLTYYTQEELRSDGSLTVEPIPAPKGEPERIFVHSDIWPEYRWMREENASLGVLNADGKPAFRYDVPVNLQAARLVDPDGDGTMAIGVLTADARLRFFDLEGRQLQDWDFYSQHQKFDETYGKPNQRTPAGLYTMPASFGVWKDPSGKPRWVIGRYCMLSFLDDKGALEGVLRGGSYWNPCLLPESADFNGDGKMETLAVSTGEFFHVDGDAKPYVSEPGGDLYYPQIHRQETFALPAVDTRQGLAGAPILAFQILALDKSPRYVLLVRENCLVIYDAKERRIAFSWIPVVPLTAGAVTRDDPDRLVVLCASKDRQVWRLEWNKNPAKLERFSTVPFPDRIAGISARPALWPDRAVLAGEEGIYLTGGPREFDRIATGDFSSAAFLYGGGKDPAKVSVVAATAGGDVVRFDPVSP